VCTELVSLGSILTDAAILINLEICHAKAMSKDANFPMVEAEYKIVLENGLSGLFK
jgi:hypothetical protein